MLKIESVMVIKGFQDTDCSNKGITSNNEFLTVAYGDELAWDSDADLVLCDGSSGERVVIKDETHLLVVMGTKGGYVKATSRVKKDGMLGPMSGGNYVVNNNGMGIIKYPISVHDRFETAEQYAALSN